MTGIKDMAVKAENYIPHSFVFRFSLPEFQVRIG